ncbi:MAG: HAD family hydrolase [Actinomycetota bacterium]|nr:HAD family hydrolase [Actinomycetota bacterium]
MGSKPRPRAVLFDLFNTLIPGGSRQERDTVSQVMAQTLGVDPDAMADLVRNTFDDRTRGRLGDLRQTVAWLAARLGGTPSETALAAAVHLRLEMTRSLHRRTWAIPTLVEFARTGTLRGLVSDCSAETPTIWPDSPLAPHFEATSFSCVTGHRKPEPQAYLVAVEQLGVDPQDCLYVGDGGSRELTGAAALGFTAIRFDPPAHLLGDPIDQEHDWYATVISDLSDLIHLLT